MNWLQETFSKIPTDDDRMPIVSFTIQIGPSWLRSINGKWELLPPNLDLWNMLLLLLMIQTGIQVIIAAIIYTTIVKRRGTLSSKMVGWFVIIPFALWFPYWLLDYLKVDNLVVRLAFGSPTIIIFFRCIEAMYGTSPHTVETNIGTYCVYYTSLLHFEWDVEKKTRIHLSFAEIAETFLDVMKRSILLSIVCSFMIETDFHPFSASNVIKTDYHIHSFYDLLSPSHLGNAYMSAVLIYLTLSFGFALTAFGDQVKGMVKTKPIFLNPLLTSTSPSDFWGRKWNLMIHRILKHGAFLPARKLVQSKYAAILFTYIMSGLLHEYSNSIMFYHRQELRNPTTGICDTCYQYQYGKLFAFFAWNGIVMMLEKPVAAYLLHRKSPQIPQPIHSTLVLLTALPVAHWYYGDWMAAKYFHHLSIGLWKLQRAA